MRLLKDINQNLTDSYPQEINKRYHKMPSNITKEKKPIDITNEKVTEVKVMVKNLTHDVGSLRQELGELKDLINRYIKDQQELAKTGWFY
jgi:uncharacterized phage infection (PIP) family protein YhgE